MINPSTDPSLFFASKSKVEMETSIDNIPQAILIEILLNETIPVKSLVRFTLVSKSWQALITSPSFISRHLTKTQQETTKNHDGILLLRHFNENDKKERYTLHPDNDDDFILKSSEINFPLKSHVGFYQIVGSCNGLVCLCDDDVDDDNFGIFPSNPPICTIILWNPSIQRFLELPLPSIEPHSTRFLLGFGCCSNLHGSDCKVVRIVFRSNKLLSHETEVFSLSAKSWRQIVVVNFPKCDTVFSYSQVFVNESLHWLANEKSFGNFIVVFDMKHEVFREILLPDNLVADHYGPVTHGDCLAVMRHSHASSCIWVMKEYGNVESWERLYKFELVLRMQKVIGLRKNGQFFATKYVDELSVNDPASGVLVSFDPETRQVKDLKIFGKADSFHFENFVESLVLLEGQSELWFDACTFLEEE